MNVDIKTEVTETTVIENDNAKVTVVNGKITAIKAYRTSVIGPLEFEHLAEFEGFVRNCLDVSHSILYPGMAVRPLYRRGGVFATR